MSKRNNFYEDPSLIRNSLNHAVELSEQIHKLEQDLIEQLHFIDSNRYYVRYGFNSLRGFCIKGLLFSKTQAQRIATLARRTSTPPDDGQLRE